MTRCNLGVAGCLAVLLMCGCPNQPAAPIDPGPLGITTVRLPAQGSLPEILLKGPRCLVTALLDLGPDAEIYSFAGLACPEKSVLSNLQIRPSPWHRYDPDRCPEAQPQAGKRIFICNNYPRQHSRSTIVMYSKTLYCVVMLTSEGAPLDDEPGGFVDQAERACFSLQPQ